MTVRKTTVKKTPPKGKTALKGKVIRVNKDNPNHKHTNKSEIEKEEIKCLISIGMRKSHSVATIIEELKAQNKKVSIPTVYTYIKEIRADWRTAMSENYEAHVASQFAKLDLLEERLWLMLDNSMKAEEKKTLTREGGRSLSEKTETKNRHGEVEIALAIERIWVRRNELLGITSSTINIQNNVQNNITENTTVEVTKVEFQPISDKFFGNFVIQVDDRQRP